MSINLQEKAPQSEISAHPVRFTDEERKTLEDDGAVIYLPRGETIEAQRVAIGLFWHVADGYEEEDGKNRLTQFPSRAIEVALYPDPERFFILGSFRKTIKEQRALIEEDSKSFKERLGLPNINEILPEASEVTDVLFQHLDLIGGRILGESFVRDGYWRFVKTRTPTNKEGTRHAHVGYFLSGFGLRVDDWDRNRQGPVGLGLAHWVVPIGTR